MRRSLAQIAFGLVALSTCAAVLAEDLHQWETATVIAQTIGRSPMGQCSGQVGRESNTLVVDTGTYRYSWQELTGDPDWHHFIVLTGRDQTVHVQVKFYRDGPWFVVLDNQGEKHKFCLLHEIKFQ